MEGEIVESYVVREGFPGTRADTRRKCQSEPHDSMGKSIPARGNSKSTIFFFFFLENLPNNILPLAWVVSPFMRLLSKYLSLSCLKLSTALGIKHVSYHGYKVLFNTFTSPNSSPFSLLLVSLAPDKTAFFLIFDHAN